MGHDPADPVSASYLLMGWLLYRHNGDLDVLGRHCIVDSRHRVDFLLNHSSGYIVNYGYYGDWSPRPHWGPLRKPGLERHSNSPHVHRLSVLYGPDLVPNRNRPQSTRRCSKLSGAWHSRRASLQQRVLWDLSKGGYGANNQAANAFALYLRIAPSDRIGRVVSNLVDDVKAHDYHLTTEIFARNTYWRRLVPRPRRVPMASQPRNLIQLGISSAANGATTLWERWGNIDRCRDEFA